MRRVLVDRDAGLVLGSRYVPGGGTDGWSATRLALSRVGCRASRLALGLPFVFSERVAGASKMTLRITLEGVRVTLALRRQQRARRGCRSAVGPVAWVASRP